MTIADGELDMIIQLVTARTGIIPRSSHREGIRSYLGKKLDLLGVSLQSYAAMLERDKELFMELVNESTVNETYFFREERQFALVRDKLLPQWVALYGPRPIRMWSAACSYGEEAYSLALLARASHVRAEITASDINTDVLQHCGRGVFNASSMRPGDGVQFQSLLLPYRTPERKVAFSDDIRGAITTRQINLAKMDMPEVEVLLPKKQNIIFLRNVFIYFDMELRARILRTITDKCMDDGACLFVSMSEIAQIDQSVMPPALEKIADGNVFYFHKRIGK